MSRVRGFIPALLILAISAFVAYQFLKKDDRYVINAKFKDAGGILKNYNVKIGGVPGGRVTKITLDKDDTVNVQMKLDKDAGKIGPGASASVRPVNLLGEKYVDLDPGDLNNPLPSGSVIPESKTAVPVEIDDALNILDPDTRTAMKLIISEAGISMAGRGTDFNKMLTQLPPALDSARKVVSEVAAENKQLENAIVKGDRVINEFNDKSDNITNFVDSAGRALQTAAERRAQLGATVRTAPAALTELRQALGNLDSTAKDLTPAAVDLQVATPSLANTLRRAPAFAKDAKGTLDEAQKVAPTLNKLALQSTPTLKRLQPSLKNLSQFSADSKELTDWLADKKAWERFLGFMAGWAGLTDEKDGVSHVFRINPVIDTQLLTSVLSEFQNTLKKDKKQEKKAQAPTATVPAATQEAKPTLPKVPSVGPLLSSVQQTIDKTLGAVGDTVDGVVGKLKPKDGDGKSDSSGNTKKLLNYLLGP